jgi:hypothetical protein
MIQRDRAVRESEGIDRLMSHKGFGVIHFRHRKR